MRLEIELRCIRFPLIVLEMLLQLDWSLSVEKYIGWTSFGKAHTGLFKVPQLTEHVRAKTMPDVEGIVCRAPRQDCVEAQIWGRVPKKESMQHWRCPTTQWPPSFLNGWSLEPPRLFLELAARPNWAIGGEGPWSGRWPKTRRSLWQGSRVLLWRRTTISAALHQSDLHGRVARQKPLLNKKGTRQPTGVCQEAHKRTQTMRNKILWIEYSTLCPECQASCLEEPRHGSSPGQYHPYGEEWWWQHHAVEMFFSTRDWETSQDWGKD